MSNEPIPIEMASENDEALPATIARVMAGEPQIHVGETPPSYTSKLWLDTTPI